MCARRGSARRRRRAHPGLDRPHRPPGAVRLPGDRGRHCIASRDEVCSAAISILRDERTRLRSIIATRPLFALDGSQFGGSQPLSLVTDAWEVEALDDARNEVSVALCQRDGVDDNRIVAVIRPDFDTEWYVRFERLWRLDAQGRLQAMPAQGVRCLNEGFGYDG